MRDTLFAIGGVVLLIVLLAVGYRIVSIAIGPVTIGLQPPTLNSTNPTGTTALPQRSGDNTPVMNPTSLVSQSQSRSQSMFAVLVGVTDRTAFSTQDARNYTYSASVNNVDEAIIELGRVFESGDIVYVVHVPDLRITPGNTGACKLYLHQVNKLAEYPPGWIIGGDNIVPDEFENRLEFCYDQ